MTCRISKLRFVMAITAALLLGSAAGADEPTQEYRVKAAFIFNFMQFVEWPRGTFGGDNDPFVVAVVGQDPFDGALEQAMAGKTIRTRSIVVRHFASADQIEPCQLLFVPSSQDESLENIMKNKVASLAVLTIGESDAFRVAGGIIRFYSEDNKVRFEIDPQAAEHAHLKISSKLLKLARIFTR
jgi:preprotein translocase subunit Sec61beta